MLIAIVVLGVLIGFLAGGRLSRLAKVEFSGVEVLAGALAVQVAVPWLFKHNQMLAGLLHLLSYAMILLTLAKNRRTPAVLLMTLGVFLNFLVIALNGGMPVEAANIPVGYNDGVHRAMSDGTRLWWLADVIRSPLGGSMSIGDVFMSIGVALFIIGGMMYRPRHLIVKQRQGSA